MYIRGQTRGAYGTVALCTFHADICVSTAHCGDGNMDDGDRDKYDNDEHDDDDDDEFESNGDNDYKREANE